MKNNYTNEVKKKVAGVYIADTFNKNFKNSKCMFNGCQKKPINSHCFQKAMLEENLSSNNMAYYWSYRSFTDGIRNNKQTNFIPTHINTLSTFPGFCENHDYNLFSAFEDKNSNKDINLKDYAFLNAYRNLCHYLHESYAMGNEASWDTPPKNPVIKEMLPELQQKMKTSFRPLNLEIKVLEELKDIFEQYIQDDGQISPLVTDDFQIFTYSLDCNLLFASLACKKISYSKYPISLGILPATLNIPNIFYIVAHKQDIEIFNAIKETALECGKVFIQNIVLKSTCNTVIHPNLYNKLNTNKKFIINGKLAITTELNNLLSFMSGNEVEEGKTYGFDLFK